MESIPHNGFIPIASEVSIRPFLSQFASPDEPPQPFEDVLASLGPDPSPLADAYDFVRINAMATDNFGETQDERDLYVHLDRLADGVKGTFTQSYCRAGCSSCCHYPVALFTTSYSEWRIIKRFIDSNWTVEQKENLVTRYSKTFTSVWRFLILMLQNSYLGVILIAPFMFPRRVACPFLVNDQCSIYPVRPYQCRAFGHFAARTWSRAPKVYACNEQGNLLLGQLEGMEPQIQLPVMNPIVRKIRQMCRGPRLALPLWVGIWVDRYKRANSLSSKPNAT